MTGLPRSLQARSNPQSRLKMTLASKEAQRRKTSKKELDNTRALIARDLRGRGHCRPFGRPEVRDCLQRCTPGGKYGYCLCGVSDHEQGRPSPGLVGKHETCVEKTRSQVCRLL